MTRKVLIIKKNTRARDSIFNLRVFQPLPTNPDEAPPPLYGGSDPSRSQYTYNESHTEKISK